LVATAKGHTVELPIWLAYLRPVRLAYQPPANNIFLSEQTSHHQPANSTFLSEQINTSHQQPAKRTLLLGSRALSTKTILSSMFIDIG
jgi:hypothetical protein